MELHYEEMDVSPAPACRLYYYLLDAADSGQSRLWMTSMASVLDPPASNFQIGPIKFSSKWRNTGASLTDRYQRSEQEFNWGVQLETGGVQRWWGVRHSGVLWVCDKTMACHVKSLLSGFYHTFDQLIACGAPRYPFYSGKNDHLSLFARLH